MTTYWKPGTGQYRIGTPEQKEFLKNFGWEPLSDKAKSTAKVKTETPEPAVEEVGDDDNKGD